MGHCLLGHYAALYFIKNQMIENKGRGLLHVGRIKKIWLETNRTGKSQKKRPFALARRCLLWRVRVGRYGGKLLAETLSEGLEARLSLDLGSGKGVVGQGTHQVTVCGWTAASLSQHPRAHRLPGSSLRCSHTACACIFRGSTHLP